MGSHIFIFIFNITSSHIKPDSIILVLVSATRRSPRGGLTPSILEGFNEFASLKRSKRATIAQCSRVYGNLIIFHAVLLLMDT